MKASLILFALVCAQAFAGLNPCRKFICRNPADPKNPDVCGLLEKKSPVEWIEYVGNCDTDKICPIHDDDTESKRCIENSKAISWPGNKASGPEHCLTKNVVDGMCRGAKQGEACTQHLDCDVGLYCGSHWTCDPAGEEGANCDADYHLCQSYLYCREGVCSPYGSLQNGDSIGRGSEDLCASRYANKHGVCEDPPYLRGKVLVDSANETCSYTNGEDKKAVCGFHSEGKAICRPGAHNLTKEWNELLTYLKAKPQCNPYLSPLAQCDYAINIGAGKYYRGRMAYTELHYYSHVQGVLSCMEKYVDAEYFEFFHAHRGFSSKLSAGLAVLVGLVVFLI